MPAPRRARPGGGSERLARELDRLLGEVTRGVEAIVDRSRPTPALLHDLHRDMRRLRTGLTIWERLALNSEREKLPPLDHRLQRLAQLIGQVRDRDVSVDLLESVERKARSRGERDRLNRYRAQLHDDARTGRELLRAFLRSERDALLFEEVGAVIRAPSRPIPPQRLRHLLGKREALGRAKLVAAHRKARRRPTMDRLHRLRIRVRRLRQISDLATAVDSEPSAGVTATLRRLQQHLGRLHDLDVLLDSLGPALRATRWARALRKERRRQRRAIVRTIRSFRPERVSAQASTRAPGRGTTPHRPVH